MMRIGLPYIGLFKKISLLLTVLVVTTLTAYTQKYIPNGNAFSNGGDFYTITPDLYSQNGSVWSENRIDLRYDFDIQYTVNLGSDPYGADGMAFVLQRNGNKVQGSGGSGMGYGGISPSFVLEYDSYVNSDLQAYDPPYDHMCLMRNGDFHHNSGQLISPVPLTDQYGRTVKDGKQHASRVIWNAASKTMDIYFDDKLKFTYTNDLINDFFAGDPAVYFGFTASTGGAKNLHAIYIDPVSRFHVYSLLPPPIPTITANGPTAFCQGGSVNLSSTAAKNSLQFNGSNYVEAANTTSTSLTNALTVEAWVKTDDPNQVQYIVSKGTNDQDNGQYGILIVDGKFQFHFWQNSAHRGVTGTTQIQAGKWYHVAGTWDGNISTLYVDGVSEGGQTSFVGPITANAGPLEIGRLGLSGLPYQLYGAIDEVRIWNRARTQSEILSNKNGSVAANASLVAYYKLDEGSGSTTADAANGNTASLVNSPSWVVSGAPINYASYAWSTGANTPTITANTTGSYNVTVTDVNGNAGTSAPVNVSILTASANITASGPISFCSGGNVLLTANSGTSYLWSNGATTQSISVTASGIYTVTVMSGGCSATSAPVQITVTPLVINCPPDISVFTEASTLLANYPLQSDLLDATGQQGAISVFGSSPPSVSNGMLCINGNYPFTGYPNTQNALTPNISALTENNFSIVVDFKLSGTSPSNMPVIIAGGSYRWLGIEVDPNGKLGIKYNNNFDGWSTTSILTNQWYTAQLSYNQGIATLYLDGSLVFTQNIGSLNSGNNYAFTPSDGSTSQELNGCIRNLKIFNGVPPNCGVRVMYSVPSVGGTCAGASVTQTSGLPSGSNFPVGTTLNTFTVSNGTSSATCSFNVIVTDNEKPRIKTKPVSVILVNGSGSITTSDVDNGSTDNCGISTTTLSKTNFDCSNKGVNIVTYTVTDIHNNSASANVTVTVIDASSPVATIASLPVISGQCFASATTVPTATDGCGAIITATTTNATVFNTQGTFTINWLYTAANGNKTSQIQQVIVKDNVNPVITGVPSDVTVECDGVPAQASVISTDNCTVASSLAYQFPSNGIRSVLTHRYSFENSFADGKGSGNGTAIGTVGFTQGIMGTAASFNGTGGYVNLGTAASISGTVNFAISVWVKTSSSAPQNIIQQRDAEFNGEYILNITSNHDGSKTVPGAVYFMIYNNGFQFEIFSGTRVDDGKWHHIVAEREGGSGRIFIDGVLAGSGSGPVTALTPGIGTYVGEDVRDHNKFFNGQIDELKIIAGSSCTNTYDLERTWSVKDASGNQAAVQQIVSVKDTKAPVITLPSNIPLSTESGQCSAVATYTATAVDNCSSNVTISYSIPSGSRFNVGTTPVTVTAIDACGNTATGNFTVTVTDNQIPVITTNGDKSVNNDIGKCGATVVVSATAADICGVGAPIGVRSDGLLLTDLYPVGITKITWTVIDIHGNAALPVIQTIVVTDNEPPTITAPATVNVNTDFGSNMATKVSLGTPVTNDNCDVASIVNDHPSITYPVGNTTVTWTVTDIHGLPTTATQTVTVTDKEPPAIASLAAIVKNNDPGICGAVVTYNLPQVIDNVSSTLISITEGGGDNTIEFDLPVTYNVSSINFSTTGDYKDILHGHGVDISVRIELYNSLENIWIPIKTIKTGTGDYHFGSSSINFPLISQVNKIRFVASQPVYAAMHLYEMNITLNSISLTQTGGLTSGAVFPVGTTVNTFQAMDQAGNPSFTSFTVTVIDAEKPVIVSSTLSSTQYADGNCSWTGSFSSFTVTDNCASALSVTENDFDAKGNLLYSGVSTLTQGYHALQARTFPLGINTVVLTVTDAAGNISDKTIFTVKVVDNTNPTIKPSANITQASDPAICGAYVKVPLPVTSDNCSVQSVVNSFTKSSNATGQYPVGTTEVTWTVTDGSGNKTTATQNITVTDNEPPVIMNVPVSIMQTNDAGSCGAIVTWAPVTASDNCGVTSFVSNNVSGQFFPIGTTVVTFTAIDIHNNTSTASFTITITDNEAPLAITQPKTVTLINGAASILPADINNRSSDNCGAITISASKTTFTCADAGTNLVTLTVTDSHGNTSSASAIVTVIGEVPTSTIQVTPSSTVYTGGVPTDIYLGYGSQTVTLTDNVVGITPISYAWSGSGLSCSTCANPTFAPTAAGGYAFSVKATNQYGCTATSNVSICVRDIRVTPVANSKVYVCHTDLLTGISQTLTLATGSVGNQLLQNPQDLLGVCGMPACSTAVVPAAASFDPVSPVQVITKDTEDKTQEGKLLVKVSPNPSNTVFTFIISTHQKNPVQVRLMDEAGRFVEGLSNAPIGATFRMGSKLVSGIYFAEVVQGKERVVVKLIKQN